MRAVGRSLGRIGYALLAEQRRLTQEHLDLALGRELSARQRRRIARGVFNSLGQTAMEWLKIPSLSSDDLKRLITCEGIEHLQQAVAKGNGVIGVSAHLGNWELVPLYMKSLGFEGGVLARRLRYPEYESFLIGMRGDKGVPTFARGSLKEAVTLLRANQLIGVIPDQDVDSLDGVFVEFFGRMAYTPVGPAALSLMTGAPIVPCFVVREGGRFRLTIEPPVTAPPAANRSEALIGLTQAWSRVVESHIRRHPEQWVWMHRRWKTQQTSLGSAPAPSPASQPPAHPAVAILLIACCLSLVAGGGGCAKKPMIPDTHRAGADAPSADAQGDQQMSSFTLTGYASDGGKRWVLDGTGATLDGNLVTILRPQATGFDPQRTSYLTASVASVEQNSRHIRLEHDVTIHTSDGLWLSTPVLNWIPDQERIATDQPVRLETDHMLVQGFGGEGATQLKRAVILRDVEVVLNPSDRDEPSVGAKHVHITCDGPLSFDYEQNIATFERNVHVRDPNGELFSDTLIAYLDGASHTIRYAEAIGHVRILQQQHTATSERAVYEPAVGKITLVGRPSLLVYPEPDAGGSLSFGGLAASSP